MTEYKTPIPCRIYNASGGNVCGTDDIIDDVKGKKQSQINTEIEEYITELEHTAVKTGSYDASVSVGLADNFSGDSIVDAEFYKRKTGGTQSVGSGIAAIKEIRGKSIVWNQLVDANTTEVATISGRKYITKINDVKSIITSTGAAITINDASVDQVFDITLMFGTGNEPATVTEFEKMFPLYYYDYNAGEVIPFAGQNLVTTGKNQYNPATGKANLLGGQQYQIGGTYTKIYPTVTLVDYTYGSPVVSGTYYTNANSHYVGAKTVSAYDNTKTYTLGSYCVNNDNIYKSNVAIETAEEFDATHWDVIADVAAMVIEGIFTLWDITPDSNGLFTLTKDTEVTIVGGNDTDTMIAIYDGENSAYEPYEKHTLPLYPSQWRDTNGNLVFLYGGMFGYGAAYDYAKVDADGYIRKAMRVYERRAYESGDVTSGNIITDGMTYTFYPLAEPVEVELATPVYAKYLCDKDGTEKISPANGTAPYTTMANLSILYAMDARGEIKNLPKNYLSKESVENMLDAMVTAGIIASYTMTYDAANGRYAFTIVAPA